MRGMRPTTAERTENEPGPSRAVRRRRGSRQSTHTTARGPDAPFASHHGPPRVALGHMHTSPFPRGRTVGRRGGGPVRDMEEDMTTEGEAMLAMAAVCAGIITFAALTLAFG